MTKDLDKKVAHAMELHYERGFIDGMQKQKQMQSSVDKAVNRMAQTQEPVAHTLNCVCGAVWDIKANGSEEMVHTPDTTTPQRTWVDLTDEEIDNINYTSAHMLAREVLAKFKEKNT
jgi:hypothetical protein